MDKNLQKIVAAWPLLDDFQKGRIMWKMGEGLAHKKPTTALWFMWQSVQLFCKQFIYDVFCFW